MTNGSQAAVKQNGPAGTSANGRRLGLPLRAREMIALGLLTLCVVALSTAVHLYHVRQIVWSSTLREANLVAGQIYSQSARALSRGTSQDPRAVLSQDQDLRALPIAFLGKRRIHGDAVLQLETTLDDGRAQQAVRIGRRRR